MSRAKRRSSRSSYASRTSLSSVKSGVEVPVKNVMRLSNRITLLLKLKACWRSFVSYSSRVADMKYVFYEKMIAARPLKVWY